jgi:16S rRNA (cytosine967-C5)-methyltransferase
MVSAPRQIAVRILRDLDAPGDFLEHRLERDRFVQQLRPDDRRLIQELIFGVVRWRATLDWIIARRTQGRPQKPLVQTILRLAFYQLFWLDRIPAYAVLNDSVELARRFSSDAVAGFVNAVLRTATREREAIAKALEELRQTDPATATSHPAWLVERWQKSFGIEACQRLLAWDNTPPDTFVRINPHRLAPEKLIELWRDEDVIYEFRRFDWTGENLVFELKAHPPLTSLPSFKRGGFYVQDPSTLLAVKELSPKPGETILDFCAAPGGKTTYIAQLMEDQGTIIAHDSSHERLRLVRENASRLGFTCIFPTSVAPSPAREKGKFDRILMDVPCSNTGVLRRRLEARWRLQPEGIPHIAAEQLKTLQSVTELLKSGGRLVYSTCSLEAEENREVVDRFLAVTPSFSFVRDRQLSPAKEKVDGAYVAVLVKN